MPKAQPPALDHPRLDHLCLLTSAIAGRTLTVTEIEAGERAWTDGSTVFLPADAAVADRVRMLGVQASLLAAGSLDANVVRPLARRLEVAYHKRGTITQDMLALIFLLIMVSALITELLGMHALIGAFLAGVAVHPETGKLYACCENRQEVWVLAVLDVDPAVLCIVLGVVGRVEVKHLHGGVLSLALRAVSAGSGPLRGWHFLDRRPGSGSEARESR